MNITKMIGIASLALSLQTCQARAVGHSKRVCAPKKNEPVQLTEKNFDKYFPTKRPTVVEAYADWCGPCKRMRPVLKRYAEKHPEVTVLKLDVEKDESLEKKLGAEIEFIPSIIFYKGNKNHLEQGYMSLPYMEEIAREYFMKDL